MNVPADPARKSQMPVRTDTDSRQGILVKTTPADLGPVKLPALTPHLQFHPIGQQRTLLVSESFNTLLHGKLHADLLPLLDGRRPQDEIVAALEGAHDATDVLAAIASLSAKGYVVSGDHGMDRRRAAYWSSLGASPRWVEQRLAESRVAVEGDECRLIRRLEESGAGMGTGDPRLTVIVCDDYLGARLGEVNRRRLEAGAPWTLVRPRGMEALFGPVFRADKQGPCWDCLAFRFRGHREVHHFLRNLAGEEAAFKPFATQPTVLEALYGLIAAEIVKWLVLDETAPMDRQAIALDVGAFAVSHHRVTRRPQCPACGDEAMYRPDRPPVPLRLKASPKAHRNSGGARSVSPEVTLAKYRHLVSPIGGVVTWLKRTTDESDPWLHVYWAGANPGMRSRSLSSLRRSLRSKSAGKGSTREQSEVSALCEAVERYSGRPSWRRDPHPQAIHRVRRGRRGHPSQRCATLQRPSARQRGEHQRQGPPLQHRPGASRSRRRDRLDTGLVADPAAAPLPADLDALQHAGRRARPLGPGRRFQRLRRRQYPGRSHPAGLL